MTSTLGKLLGGVLSGLTFILTFGQVKSEIQELVPVPIHSLGYLSDEKKIVSLYNAVDLFVISSLDENLPNMVME